MRLRDRAFGKTRFRANTRLSGRGAAQSGDHAIVQTIAFVAAKGGVGKTTLAASLAAAALAEDPGRKVGIVDLDPQGSLTAWWNEREAEAPALYQVGKGSLQAQKLAPIMNGTSLLLLDCPPGFASIHEEAMRAGDLAIIPTAASALDLAAVASTVEMAERLGVPYLVALNRAVFNSRLAGQAVAALRQRGAFVLPPVHQRVAIAEAMASGRAVVETEPGSRAAQEVMALWGAIAVHLRRLPSRRRYPLVELKVRR